MYAPVCCCTTCTCYCTSHKSAEDLPHVWFISFHWIALLFDQRFSMLQQQELSQQHCVYSLFYSLFGLFAFCSPSDCREVDRLAVWVYDKTWLRWNKSCVMLLHENAAAVTTINNSKWVFALIYLSLACSLACSACALTSPNILRLILWIKNRLKINWHTRK